MAASRVKAKVISDLLDKWGKVPRCNEKAERAPHVGEFCFPLCWRCTMMITGLLAGVIICVFAYPGTIIGLLSLSLAIPCFIDGLLQTTTDYVSTNTKRILLGFVAGVGMFIGTFTVCNVFFEFK